MTMLGSVLVDLLVKHPDAGVMLGLSVYLGYEIRFGRLEAVQRRQEKASEERRVLGIAVYKIVKGDPQLDEEEFRELLWDDDGEAFPSDLVIEGPEAPPGGDD